MVKPQFEIGRAGVGKREILKDPLVEKKLLKSFLIGRILNKDGLQKVCFLHLLQVVIVI
ncbi:protein of unknown function [Bartonella clarridgeiae 73]|uniref:Uncharacterized protein n=1 Tax=Bartonella clarridgeiae (strain CCUG 45776 / CIP 104772 / 73) TaxID=696125 RepID=E6YGX5_BARC7|nr:protein of unknown function [Bartonella clarridgeiae 73]